MNMTGLSKIFRNPKVTLSLAVILIYLSIPLLTTGYMLRVMNIALITYMCVLSVYVLLGMCGQNSFAQAGLWGVGAYITANMVVKFGLPSIVALIIGAVGTAIFAFVLGFAFFRLRKYYFTFASVGLMAILSGVFMNWSEGTGAAMGFSDIPNFSIFGYTFASETSNFYLILTFSIIIFCLMILLNNSPLGRSFMAIRDNEIAANCLAINSLLTKSIAFAISGALCGTAGALYAFLTSYLSYKAFTYQESIMFLVMIMLGGTISPVGAIIGTMIISLLQEWVRPLQNYMQMIYGICIMIIMIVQPEGILGGAKVIYDKLYHRKKAYSNVTKSN
jgi:branched-chain amino acid transport system permease protein